MEAYQLTIVKHFIRDRDKHWKIETVRQTCSHTGYAKYGLSKEADDLYLRQYRSVLRSEVHTMYQVSIWDHGKVYTTLCFSDLPGALNAARNIVRDARELLRVVLAAPIDTHDRWANYIAHTYWPRPAPSGEECVGLELECFGELDPQSLKKEFARARVLRYVGIGDDCSIRPDHGRGREIRITASVPRAAGIVERVCQILQREGFGVNRSCGMHVHLDCRGYTEAKFRRLGRRLIQALPFLNKLVDETRIGNRYCRTNKKFKIRVTSNRHAERRYAINGLSWSTYHTVEVRLHHGSIDAQEINNWVRVLQVLKESPINKEWNLDQIERFVRSDPGLRTLKGSRHV